MPTDELLQQNKVYTHDFKESLGEGDVAELFVSKYFGTIFSDCYSKFSSIELYDYENNKEKQLAGIDGISRAEITYDVKTRDYSFYRFKDILLEVMLDNRVNYLGWLYTSEADIIIYLWYNNNRSSFVDGYILFLNEIRKWYRNQHSKPILTETTLPGLKFKTVSVVIPIEKFPACCLQRIDSSIFRK